MLIYKGALLNRWLFLSELAAKAAEGQGKEVIEGQAPAATGTIELEPVQPVWPATTSSSSDATPVFVSAVVITS